jgi:hypothetical protein
VEVAVLVSGGLAEIVVAVVAVEVTVDVTTWVEV